VSGPVVVVGDVLLDREIVGTVDRLCPEAPVPVLAERSVRDRPGGAGLAALFAAADGAEVVLVAGFSADEAGGHLREMLRRHGVRVVAVPLRGATAQKIRFRAGNHLLLRLDRGDTGSTELGPVPPQAVEALRSAGSVLVSDYGRGVAAHPELAAAIRTAAQRVPVVWDPHPKGPVPVPGARLVTPNRAEAAGFVAAAEATRPTACNGGPSGSDNADPVARDARYLLRRWGVGAVCVTTAERGAVLAEADAPPVEIPAPSAATGDACGAGDRFASAAVAALAADGSTVDAARSAVAAATAYVAAGGALNLPAHAVQP
jgi:rfaE bifunctional protein kinase chain/domain